VGTEPLGYPALLPAWEADMLLDMSYTAVPEEELNLDHFPFYLSRSGLM
jgi:hypothetical protein